MDEATARARLVDLVAASVFPTLTTEQIDRLLASARRQDKVGVKPDSNAVWTSATAYELGDVVTPVNPAGLAYVVTDAGTSGATEPVWPTSPGSVVDGSVTWALSDTTTAWQPTYDLAFAAAEGWRIKAANVSNRHAFGANQGNYNPEQVFEHCMRMADYYAAKQVSAIDLRSDRWSGTGRLNAAHHEDAV